MNEKIDGKFSDVEDKIENFDIRLTCLENAFGDAGAPASPGSVNAEVWDHIKALEMEVSTLKITTHHDPPDPDMERTVVIG
eukprot:8464394-Pyramimonas_sp.AAC.1